MVKDFSSFQPVDPFALQENVFDLLDKEWMLITAGNEQQFNTMTASWGSLGFLWRKPISIIFVRPQRHTYQFTEEYDTYTLSFFGHGNFRKELSFCGSKSGRDYDKVKETGLVPIATPNNSMAFEQARLILECRKLYADDIKPNAFVDTLLDKEIYPTKDHHRFYIGEIVGCYQKKI